MPDTNTARPLAERLIGTLWVCECCYMAHAADGCGEHPHGMDDYPEPLAQCGGLELAAGMAADEHDDHWCLRGFLAEAMREYPDLDWPDVPGDYECECEVIEFSHSPCEGCGAGYYGKRYAITAWSRN